MCGRFVITTPREAIEALFDIKTEGEYTPRYNITPTQPVLYVHRWSGEERRTDYARWGLIPSWHKDPQNAQPMINARIETVLEKPSFKAAVRHRRVLVPATHFYEWRRDATPKQPYAVGRTTPEHPSGLFAFAGIVDEWTGKDGEVLPTLALLTQAAQGAVADVHHRMPVTVPTAFFNTWLECRAVDAAEALAPLRNPARDAWTLWPVDMAVNKATSDGSHLLHEVVPEPERPPAPDRQMSLF
ncbi:MAG: SOS response-associated peptidase [Pseudomonadota bacterium]